MVGVETWGQCRLEATAWSVGQPVGVKRKMRVWNSTIIIKS